MDYQTRPAHLSLAPGPARQLAPPARSLSLRAWCVLLGVPRHPSPPAALANMTAAADIAFDAR
jgi:hypothetical protein